MQHNLPQLYTNHVCALNRKMIALTYSDNLLTPQKHFTNNFLLPVRKWLMSIITVIDAAALHMVPLPITCDDRHSSACKDCTLVYPTMIL